MSPLRRSVQMLLLMFAGWVNRHQLDVIEYLQEENRVLKERLGGRRLRFTDAERRRLAVHIAGMTPHPDNSWMMQIARNITDVDVGFLRHERDAQSGRTT
jgi:hypothetical protein